MLVPGYTDAKEDLIQLGAFINTLDNVERFEILPYHQLGVHKWEAMNFSYPLKDVQPPTDNDVKLAYQFVNFKGNIP